MMLILTLMKVGFTRENDGEIQYTTVLKSAQSSIPAKRFADPSEIANIVLFLSSDHGAYINGVNLVVDGGLTKGY